jgi:hypothetical protein
VRHGSWPRYPLSSIVADMRRSVRFTRQHAKEYDVDPNRIGVFGSSGGGQLALLLGTTGDSGDPSDTDPVLRESNRVAAVVANFAPMDLARWATQQPVFKLPRPKRPSSHPFASSHPARLPPSPCTATPTRPSRSTGGDHVRGVVEGGRARVVHSNQGRGTRVRERRPSRSRARLCRNDAVVRTASGERGEVAACPQRKAASKSHFELCRNCVRCPRNSPTHTDVHRFTSRRMLWREVVEATTQIGVSVSLGMRRPNCFPSVLLQPLGHLSVFRINNLRAV